MICYGTKKEERSTILFEDKLPTTPNNDNDHMHHKVTYCAGVDHIDDADTQS